MAALSRRAWLAATLAALSRAGQAASHKLAAEARPVAGFDRVHWQATGELVISQAAREQLIVEAEPAVLAHIVSQVRDRTLTLGFGDARIQTREAIRFRLDVKSLASLETRGSGSVRIGAMSAPSLSVVLGGSEDIRIARLQARSLDARLDGAGALVVDGGQVDRQRVVITGSGNYTASALASRLADVAIDGSGEIRVAVSERLDARIGGSGAVRYRGQPKVTQAVTGAGEVSQE